MPSEEYSVKCDKNSAKIIRKSAILRNKDVTAYYRFIFNECDTNNDGRINTLELKQFLAANEENIPDRVVTCIHNCFDKDHDRQLDFDEFLDLINHPTITNTFNRIGSRYLKFVAVSSVRTKSLKLIRTPTDTGLYEEEAKCNFCAIGIITISILQLICFYVDRNCNSSIEKYTEFDPGKRYQIWRYVTYVLDHVDEHHLYVNLVLQLLLGLPLEVVHSWRVPLIYLAGATGGCLAHAGFENTGLVGGSGGMYAFFSAHLATVIMNWREISHPIVHFLIFAVVIIFDSIRNFTTYLKDSKMSNISYTCHLGGVVIGLLLGVLILRNLKITAMENLIWYTCAIILSILTIAFIILNVVRDMEN